MTPARLARVLEGSGGVCQLVTSELAGTVAGRVRALGRPVHVLDTSAASDKASFLDAVARDLALPAWFGRNWDALVDALRDAPTLEPGAVLVWRGADALAAGDPDVFATAVEIVDEAARGRDALALVVTPVALPGVSPR